MSCDTCGGPTPPKEACVHLLPWVGLRLERVELTGPCGCDPGGYWFQSTRWRPELTDTPEKWSMRDQVNSKTDGARSVALVDARLEREG
jgi:hypothetical protein